MGLHVFAYSNTTTAVPDFFHFIIFLMLIRVIVIIKVWCGFNFLFFFSFFVVHCILLSVALSLYRAAWLE